MSFLFLIIINYIYKLNPSLSSFDRDCDNDQGGVCVVLLISLETTWNPLDWLDMHFVYTFMTWIVCSVVSRYDLIFYMSVMEMSSWKRVLSRKYWRENEKKLFTLVWSYVKKTKKYTKYNSGRLVLWEA